MAIIDKSDHSYNFVLEIDGDTELMRQILRGIDRSVIARTLPTRVAEPA